MPKSIFYSMRIPVEKEIVMKKAILKAIEYGQSAAKLADSFGVSKSTVYKYRRALRNQGFVKKNENGIYVLTNNKFSALMASASKEREPQPTNNCEERLQEKLQQIRQATSSQQELEDDKGLLKKIFGKFKKS